MPFVKSRHQRGGEEGQCCPLQAPPRAEPGKAGTPRTEQQSAEGEVADEVSGFAKHHVPLCKVHRVDLEQKMEEREENSPRVVSRAQVRGFHHDDRQPND